MSEEHAWMRPVLASLFDSVDPETARAAMLSDDRRGELRSQINRQLGDAQIPPGQYSDNLFQGLLALRMKFNRADAMHKLELNLSMRASRGNRP